MRPPVDPGRGGEARERSEALLLAHLNAEQRREYEYSRTVTVVKEGVLWRTVLSYASVLVLVLALAFVGRIVPRLEVAFVLAAFVFVTAIASFLVWIPSLAVACARRRTWILGAGRRPILVVGARRIAFCVRVLGDVPEADRLLACKNVLEGDERYFLRKANALV